MGSLSGKVAIVTGAAQGIGAWFAAGLAAEGAAVVVVDLADATAVAERIAAAGGVVSVARCDVTDPASIEAMIDAAVADHGGVDILVNNAALFGTLENTSMFDLDLDEWDQVMRVNAKGPFLCTRAAAPVMRERGGGSIVNIGTGRIWRGYPMLLHYDASKGALDTMTRAMARELGDWNIRVNCVAPGLTMSENVLRKAGIADRAPRIAMERALKRDQQPEDLVGTVVFLASDAARFITGQSLAVDGGQVMR